jgi:outer membrane protein TolC
LERRTLLIHLKSIIYSISIAAFGVLAGVSEASPSPVVPVQSAVASPASSSVQAKTPSFSSQPIIIHPGDTITLDEAIAQAFRENPGIQSVDQSIQNAIGTEDLNKSQRAITLSGDVIDSYSSYRSSGVTGSATATPSISSFTPPSITDTSTTSLYTGVASVGSSASSSTVSAGGSTTSTTGATGSLSPTTTTSSGSSGGSVSMGGTGTGNAPTNSPNLVTSAARAFVNRMAAAASNSSPINANDVTTQSSTAQSGSFNNYNASISATKIIDITNVIGRAADVFRKNTDFYRLEKLRQQNELALTVKKVYFTIIEYQANVDTAKESLVNANITLKDANANYSAGAVPEYDVLSAESQVASAQEALISANNNLAVEMQTLCNLLGISTDMAFNVTKTDLPQFPKDFDAASNVKAAYGARPEMKQVDLNIQMSHTVTGLMASSLSPTLAVGGVLSYLGGDTNSANSHYDASLIAEVNIPLSDGGKTASEVKQARATEQQQNITKTQLLRNIDLEVRSAAAGVLTATDLINADRESVAYSRELVRIAQVRYENGAGTMLDFTNAQANLATAEYNLAAAEFQLQSNYASYLRAKGQQ